MSPMQNVVAIACMLATLGTTGCGTLSTFGLADAPEPAGLRLADATLSAGAPEAALRVTDGLLKHDPGSVEALERRGRALLALGRPADAAKTFAKAELAAPRRMDVLIDLAEARAAAGDAQSAELAWRYALKRQPLNVEASAGLAVSLDLQGRHDAAQALYRSILARAPDSSALRSDLGLSLALSGHSSDAIPWLRQGAEGDTGNGGARARHNLAVGLALAGDEAGAREVLGQDLNNGEINAALAGLHQFAQAQ